MRKISLLLALIPLLFSCQSSSARKRGTEVDRIGFIGRCNAIGYPREFNTLTIRFDKTSSTEYYYEDFDLDPTFTQDKGTARFSQNNDYLFCKYDYKSTKNGKTLDLGKEATISYRDSTGMASVIDMVGISPRATCRRYVSSSLDFHGYIKFTSGYYLNGEFKYYSSPLQITHEFRLATFIDSNNEQTSIGDCTFEEAQEYASSNNLTLQNHMNCFSELEFDWNYGSATYFYYKCINKNNYTTTTEELTSIIKAYY